MNNIENENLKTVDIFLNKNLKTLIDKCFIKVFKDRPEIEIDSYNKNSMSTPTGVMYSIETDFSTNCIISMLKFRYSFVENEPSSLDVILYTKDNIIDVSSIFGKDEKLTDEILTNTIKELIIACLESC